MYIVFRHKALAHNRLQYSVNITSACTGKPRKLCGLLYFMRHSLYCGSPELNLQYLLGRGTRILSNRWNGWPCIFFPTSLLTAAMLSSYKRKVNLLTNSGFCCNDFHLMISNYSLFNSRPINTLSQRKKSIVPSGIKLTARPRALSIHVSISHLSNII